MGEGMHAILTDDRRLTTLLEALDEGVVILGNDEVLFANRSALALHGVATLDDLGREVAGYAGRFRHVHLDGTPLGDGETPIARLAEGGAFADVEIAICASGSADDAPFAYASCTGGPIPGGWQMLLLRDIGARIEAERAFERTFHANPAPALLNRLSDLRYVKVNRGFLTMTGFREEDVIGRSAYEFDVLTGADERRELIERMHRGESLPQHEAQIPTADGGTVPAIVAGQPLTVGGKPAMLFTFAELSAQKRAERALRAGERRFRNAFLLAPLPAFLSDLELRFTAVNDAFCELTGYHRDELVGRTAAELRLWPDAELRVLLPTLRKQLERRQPLTDLATNLATAEGETLQMLLQAEVTELDDRVDVLGMLLDITERKRLESDLFDGLEAVMEDSSWFSRSLVEKLMRIRSGQQHAAPAELADFTPREREVLELMVEGKRNHEIGQELGIAEVTARNHVVRIYEKIGVHNRVDAVLWARDRGVSGR